MNVDELLKNLWTPEINQPVGVEVNNGSMPTPLQCQGSLNLSGSLSGKMVEEVWGDVQLGERMRSSEVVKTEPSIGEMTLEDFLAKAGVMDEPSLGPIMPMDIGGTPDCLSQQVGLLPIPSIVALSGISGQKREGSGIGDRGIEKKLKRKIKNRESAARSRARKQAYHTDLLSKVSQLEEQNSKLKKEKEADDSLTSSTNKLQNGPRYQLRRTSSAVF